MDFTDIRGVLSASLAWSISQKNFTYAGYELSKNKDEILNSLEIVNLEEKARKEDRFAIAFYRFNIGSLSFNYAQWYRLHPDGIWLEIDLDGESYLFSTSDEQSAWMDLLRSNDFANDSFSGWVERMGKRKGRWESGNPILWLPSGVRLRLQ